MSLKRNVCCGNSIQDITVVHGNNKKHPIKIKKYFSCTQPLRLECLVTFDYPVMSSGNTSVSPSGVYAGIRRVVSRRVNKGNVKHGKHLTSELGNVDGLSPVKPLQVIVFL